jgi:molybdopterin converting factor small subunit
MGTVRVEVMPWLSRYFSTERYGRVIRQMDPGDGGTVRDLLEKLAAQNVELGEVLFDPHTGRVSAHIQLLLNGRLLEIAGGMDAALAPGDTLRLMPGFSGG